MVHVPTPRNRLLTDIIFTSVDLLDAIMLYLSGLSSKTQTKTWDQIISENVKILFQKITIYYPYHRLLHWVAHDMGWSCLRKPLAGSASTRNLDNIRLHWKIQERISEIFEESFGGSVVELTVSVLKTHEKPNSIESSNKVVYDVTTKNKLLTAYSSIWLHGHLR